MKETDKITVGKVAITHLVLPIVVLFSLFVPVFIALTDLTGSFAGAAVYLFFVVATWAVLLFIKLNKLRDQTSNIKGYWILLICSFVSVVFALFAVISAATLVITV